MTEQEFINDYRDNANELIAFMWGEGFSDFYEDIFNYDGIKDFLRDCLRELDWDYDLERVISNAECVNNLDTLGFFTIDCNEFAEPIDDDDEDVFYAALETLRKYGYFDEEEEEEENYVTQPVESKPIPDSIMSVYLEKLNGSGNTEELLSILF